MLMHWRYCSLAQSHSYDDNNNAGPPSRLTLPKTFFHIFIFLTPSEIFSPYFPFMTPHTAFHSTGIPDEPGLAETYYSQFDDEFEREGAGDGDDDDDAEGTLLATVKLAGDDEVGDLINCMQNALDTSETSKLLTSSFCHVKGGLCHKHDWILLLIWLPNLYWYSWVTMFVSYLNTKKNTYNLEYWLCVSLHENNLLLLNV